MIQRKVPIIFFLLLIAVSGLAQQAPTAEHYSLIFPRSGDGITGNIIRIEGDSLIVFTTELRYIAKKDVAKIITHYRRGYGKGFVVGSLLGMYGTYYTFGTDFNQPHAYLSRRIDIGVGDKVFSTVALGLLGIAAGGGFGYLSDLLISNTSEKTYIFWGDSSSDVSQWNTLSEEIEGQATKPKIHVSFSGGSVIGSTSSVYQRFASENGYQLNFNSFVDNFYSFHYYSQDDGYSTVEATNVNWVRKIAACYSVTDQFRAGLAIGWLSEPSMAATKSLSLGKDSTKHSVIREKFIGTGYYLTGGYVYALGNEKDFEVSLTGGIGMANITFGIQGDTVISPNSYFGRESYRNRNEFLIEKKKISGMLSGEFAYYIYDRISLGLSATYLFAGSEKVDALPAVGIPEQTIPFSNVDVGFTLGLHF